MEIMRHLLLPAIIFAVFAWYLSFVASRLDRLHHRAETSWEHLDALLQRRAALAMEIASHCDLDPATIFLINSCATAARRSGQQDRSEQESALTEVLLMLVNSAQGLESSSALSGFEVFAEELTALTQTIRRSIIIHREAVDSAKRLRDKPIVKLFHLAGHAPLPIKYAFEEDAI
jgi:hypothetical protein